MIDTETGLIFVHIPRTSGTSIEVALQGYPVPDAFKHYKSSMIKCMLSDSWDSYFKFTVVRNPFDRVVSLYHSEHYRNINALTKKPLIDFLHTFTEYHPLHEYGFTQSDYIDEDMDLIIKFEDREAGLNELFEKTGIKVDPDIRERKTARPETPYQDFYDDKTRGMVEYLFNNDFSKFNYTWDEK